MAKLTDAEKVQLARVAEQKGPSQPRVDRKPARVYVDFATFASRFTRKPKPVRFVGTQWKL